MKKSLFSIGIIFLLTAGCNTNQVPAVQNTNTSSVSNTQRAASTQISTSTTTPITKIITISKLSPASGPITTKITVTGAGFAPTGNTINFGSGATISNLNSSDGTTLQFTVPSNNNPPKCPPNAMCAPLKIFPGSYNVSIANTNGKSNSLVFVVIAGQASTLGITSLNPTSGSINTTVTITGTGFTATGNMVNLVSNFSSGFYWDSSNLSSPDGKIIVFTIPSQDNPSCPDTQPKCPLRLPIPTKPGTYNISVNNSYGLSNTATFTVTQ